MSICQGCSREIAAGDVFCEGCASLQTQYQITYDGGKYRYREYRYDRMEDAVNYARLQEPSTRSDARTVDSTPAVSGRKCPSCGGSAAEGSLYCPMCGSPLPEPDSAEELAALRWRVATLEADLQSIKGLSHQVRLPETNLLSDSFWTRSWAAFGHVLVPQLILFAALYVILFVLIGITVVTS